MLDRTTLQTSAPRLLQPERARYAAHYSSWCCNHWQVLAGTICLRADIPGKKRHLLSSMHDLFIPSAEFTAYRAGSQAFVILATLPGTIFSDGLFSNAVQTRAEQETPHINMYMYRMHE